MAISKNTPSDSEYNINTDEDSDIDINFQQTFKQTFTPNQPSPPEENDFVLYKKSAEMWSIPQINEEIATLSEELQKLKKSSFQRPNYNHADSTKVQTRLPRRKQKKTGHCFCRGKYSLSAPMVQCDSCLVWYHQRCVGLSQEKCETMNTFVCETCRRSRLEVADQRNDLMILKRMKENAKLFSVKRMRKRINKNEDFYYSSKANFLSLFEKDKKSQSFCDKNLDLTEKEIRSAIARYEKKLMGFLAKESPRKMTRRRFQRGYSVEKTVALQFRSQGLAPAKKFGFKAEEKVEEFFSDGEAEKQRRDDQFMKRKISEFERYHQLPKKRSKKSKKKVGLADFKQRHNFAMVKKVRLIMDRLKLSQKAIAKDSKLTGGSTTLSSWLNCNYVYNLEEKEGQLTKWLEGFLAKNIHSDNFTPDDRKILTSGLKKQKKSKHRKFRSGERVDFLYKKKWIEGKILKSANGQYLVQFKTQKSAKKKWVASLAKRVYRLYSKRPKPPEYKSQKVRKKVIMGAF